MRLILAEPALKGLFFGLLLFISVQPADSGTVTLAVSLLGGLAIGWFAAGLGRQPPEGRTDYGARTALVCLPFERPLRVASGTVLGLAVGAFMVAPPGTLGLLAALGWAGVLVGLVGVAVGSVPHRWPRFSFGLVLGVAVAGSVLWLISFFLGTGVSQAVGIRLLIGLPFFYLLTIIASTDQSEPDAGLMAALITLASWALAGDTFAARVASLGLPVALYAVYVLRVLPRVRVLKHTLQGAALARACHYRPALVSFRRALMLDPGNARARDRFWAVHRAIDLTSVTHDPETLRLLDFDLCLRRAGSLLLEPGPSAATLSEASHLLDLVESQRPELLPAIGYWRAVADIHARRYDEAATRLRRVLDPASWPAGDPNRTALLFPVWQLALTLHPEMKRRAGGPELAVPGRRMEAIAAVERRLATQPDDPAGWELKRLLYAGLGEADYFGTSADHRVPGDHWVPGAERDNAPTKPAADFDHAYVEQLGLALIGEPAQWQRGAEYLRIAARGLPLRTPSLYVQVGQAQQRADRPEDAWHSYEAAKHAGQSVGVANLGEAERHDFFAAVRLLADGARAHGDLEAAVENYRLLAESGKGGRETYRHLADLAEQQGDIFAALRATEQGLVCDPKDKDLLERKERYYYSVTPNDFRARRDSVRVYFDVGYCLRKARALLDHKDADAGVVAWAEHLAALAEVAGPDGLAAKVLRARALRRRGETQAACALLAEVHAKKPEAFASSADEDAWFLACRLLGDAYLNELGKPERAIACFTDFRKSAMSGADTIYKLGRAYEQLGDLDRAARCYKQVIGYDGHPLVYDAREALDRLRPPG